MAAPMRVIFYTRPWTVDVYTAIADRWRADGADVDERHVTHHVEAAERLRTLGRVVTFLPRAIAEERVAEPLSVLERVEHKYGDDVLPMMRYILAERFFTGREREWVMDHFARYAQFFDRLLETERPDGLVGESPDIAPAWLAYAMAPRHGTRAVGLMPSTLPPGRLLMLRDHREIPGARERYEAFRRTGLTPEQEAAARGLQSIVLGSGTKLDYLQERDVSRLLRRVARGTVVRDQLRFARWQLRERRAGNWFVQPSPVLSAARGRARAVRARLADSRYLNDVLSGRPYAFFPLHYQPEATTLVHGSYFENQLETLRNVSRSLPVGWDLVVKEHFYMRGARELGFYRRLRELPNVRLVPFSTPTNKLLAGADITVVIASTCGLEAGLIGRPVVMLGDYPWDYAPTILKVGPLSGLPSTIRAAAGSALGPDHPDVLAFGASWDAALPEAKYYTNRQYDWLEPKNIERLARALAGALTH
jgi:hypothetical protein